MEQVDRDRILERYKNKIEEFREVVGVWEIAIHECPITLKIKVVKMKARWFQGVANYGIKGPKDIAPQKSMKLRQSCQEALEDALDEFMLSWNPKLKDQLEFVPYKGW